MCPVARFRLSQNSLAHQNLNIMSYSGYHPSIGVGLVLLASSRPSAAMLGPFKMLKVDRVVKLGAVGAISSLTPGNARLIR